jgi:hypothetical protein
MPTLFRKKAQGAAPALKGSGSGTPTYVVGGYGAAGGAAPATKAQGKGLRFTYPTQGWLPVRAAGYVVIALGLLSLTSSFGYIGRSFQASYGAGIAMGVLAAAATLLFSVIVGALIADALPSFEARHDGLAVTEFARWRVLPWNRIVRLHSMQLPGEQYIVCVEYAGRALSPEHIIYGMLAGLGMKNGVFYTSSIKDFDDLTGLIVEQCRRYKPGLRVEDVVIENSTMPVLQMALDPLATMDRVAGFHEVADGDNLESASPRPAVPRATLIRTQLALAAIPVVLFWVDTLANGGLPLVAPDVLNKLFIGTLGLLLLGMLELPFVAVAVQALGETLVGSGEQRATLETYPHLEMPRVLAYVVMLALIVIKFPFFLVSLLWLAAIAYTAYLTLLFVQRLYSVSQQQAYLAAGASALVPFFVLILFNMLRFAGIGG